MHFPSRHGGQPTACRLQLSAAKRKAPPLEITPPQGGKKRPYRAESILEDATQRAAKKTQKKAKIRKKQQEHVRLKRRKLHQHTGKRHAKGRKPQQCQYRHGKTQRTVVIRIQQKDQRSRKLQAEQQIGDKNHRATPMAPLLCARKGHPRGQAGQPPLIKRPIALGRLVCPKGHVQRSKQRKNAAL